MKINIISVISQEKRRSFQVKQMKTLSLDFDFFNAITPENISDQEYKDKANDWGRPLKKIELACYLSHHALWEKISKYNEPALILEDDALLSTQLPRILKELENEQNIDYIDLETVYRKKTLSKKEYKKVCGSNLKRLYQRSSGAGGYILWPNGAKKLLQLKNEKGIMLVDAYISQCRALKAFQLESCAVVQLSICFYRGLEFNGIQQIQESSMHYIPKGKSSLLFKLKRIIIEIKKGLRRAYLAINPLTTRRLPIIQLEDFYKPND